MSGNPQDGASGFERVRQVAPEASAVIAGGAGKATEKETTQAMSGVKSGAADVAPESMEASIQGIPEMALFFTVIAILYVLWKYFGQPVA